jgi:hypothetical protein
MFFAKPSQMPLILLPIVDLELIVSYDAFLNLFALSRHDFSLKEASRNLFEHKMSVMRPALEWNRIE